MQFFMVFALFVSVKTLSVTGAPFALSIIHINDFHARYEPTDSSGGTCNGELCVGGYARTVYTVKRLLKENSDYNPIYLNAGDNFQGTLWYNIGRWNVTSQFLNMLPADAMTLGNHEFDHGVEGVVPFLETLQSPVIVANMNASKEPTMEGKYQKSIVIERGGRKIGIIGILLQSVPELASIGQLTFSNEVTAIKEESQKLKAQGADIIIALTHCGYDLDQEIAKNTEDAVDIIVGSHSHTFLYTGQTPENFPYKSGYGDYPTVVTHASGHRTLIVQASAYALFVGYIRVYFDDNGNVLDWQGSPIYMSNDVPEDVDVKAETSIWKELVDVEGNVLIGKSQVTLEKENCYNKECNLGNFYCDAMVHSFISQWPYTSNQWSDVSVGLINPGGLRVALQIGNLTYSHLVTMAPFENDLIAYDITGDQLAAALELSFTKKSLLQVSGLRIIYDSRKEEGQQLISLHVRCANCTYPQYEPVESKKYYRIVTPTFLADGGDGFTMFKEGINKSVGFKDIDALVQYVRTRTPITTGSEKRLQIISD